MTKVMDRQVRKDVPLDDELARILCRGQGKGEVLFTTVGCSGCSWQTVFPLLCFRCLAFDHCLRYGAHPLLFRDHLVFRSTGTAHRLANDEDLSLIPSHSAHTRKRQRRLFSDVCSGSEKFIFVVELELFSMSGARWPTEKLPDTFRPGPRNEIHDHRGGATANLESSGRLPSAADGCAALLPDVRDRTWLPR